MRTTEPVVDLALALAVASAARDTALPPGMVVLGEVGLAGEVRRVVGVDRRLAEAARLGFTSAIVPSDQRRGVKDDTAGDPPGMRVVRVTDVAGAMQGAFERRRK
jgi:DNA repair protein RadA/Sms